MLFGAFSLVITLQESRLHGWLAVGFGNTVFVCGNYGLSVQVTFD